MRCVLQMRYAINWRAFQEMMAAKGATKETAHLALQACVIVDAGNMGDGEGWRVYEELIKQKVREFIFSLEHLFDRLMDGKFIRYNYPICIFYLLMFDISDLHTYRLSKSRCHRRHDPVPREPCRPRDGLQLCSFNRWRVSAEQQSWPRQGRLYCSHNRNL